MEQNYGRGFESRLFDVRMFGKKKNGILGDGGNWGLVDRDFSRK